MKISAGFWDACYSEEVSVLEVDMSKSEIILVGSMVDIYSLANIFADIFMCGLGASPSFYLGLPFGSSF